MKGWQLSVCGQRLTYVDDTASPWRQTGASPLNANESGHLFEYDYTTGSQPDLMQWVTVTDLSGDAS